MILKSLNLRNFRNYVSLEYVPSDGLNIIQGLNAQGKTNLIEAISLLSTTRPIRTARESELIRWEEECSAVAGEVERNGGLRILLEVMLSNTQRKQMRVNGLSRTRLADMLGHLQTVSFSSSDLSIVRGEPGDRRRFLDLEIAQMRPKYAIAFACFRRALDQRNSLLKRHAESRGSLESLEVWDSHLVKYGIQVMMSRKEFVEKLNPLAADAHQRLTDCQEYLALTYQPNVAPISEGTEERWMVEFERALATRRSEEIRRGTTLVGPQRDDIGIMINDKEARVFGSQGQQRTAVLSVKLGETRLSMDVSGEPPVVLLDDVMSDLDDGRKNRVMGFLRGVTQVFITCTDLHSFPRSMIKHAAVVHIDGGKALPA